MIPEWRYDRHDVGYLKLSDKQGLHTMAMGDQLLFDVAEDGTLVGIEVLFPASGVTLANGEWTALPWAQYTLWGADLQKCLGQFPSRGGLYRAVIETLESKAETVDTLCAWQHVELRGEVFAEGLELARLAYDWQRRQMTWDIKAHPEFLPPTNPETPDEEDGERLANAITDRVSAVHDGDFVKRFLADAHEPADDLLNGVRPESTNESPSTDAEGR